MSNHPSYRGKSGRMWTVLPLLLPGGHLRPPGDDRYAPARQVSFVHNEPDDTYGALRSYADRRQRSAAISLLVAGSPVTPVLLDMVDDPALPPAIVTAWSAGGSDVMLARLHEADDLAYVLESGLRWTPAQALRTLVPLGKALDSLADKGFVPIELSPDHLIYNGGSIKLAGIGRHLYRPDSGDIPDVSGMSLPSVLLLGDDHPAPGARLAVWRAAQQRALLRLAGWMSCGLPPAAWGPVSAPSDLDAYLRHAGFTRMPRLTSGELAVSLAAAADYEEDADADRRLDHAAAVLCYDDPACSAPGESLYDWVAAYQGQNLAATVDEVGTDAVKARIEVPGGDPWTVRVPWQATPYARQRGFVDLTNHYAVGDPVTIRLRQVVRAGGGHPRTEAEIVGGGGLVMRPRVKSRVEINPESLRLGLLHEHGPAVVAIAVFDRRKTGVLSSLLSGAGWVLIEPADLTGLAHRLRRLSPQVRLMIAGVPSAALTEALGNAATEIVLPSSSAAPPQVSHRPATDLPFIRDPTLEEFRRMSPEGAGRSFGRRTFAAGWAYAWASQGQPLTRLNPQVTHYADLFAANTELLIRIVTFIRRPGNRSIDPNQIDANLERAAPLLGSIPAQGRFRQDLISALLGTTYEDLYQVVTRRLLPVAARLADTYDPDLPLGGRRMDENLYDQAGVRRLGLFGRLATALPGHAAADLADVVSALDDELVVALADIPAPSLQYLVARLHSPQMLDKLRSLISRPDLDLLNRYTPAAWRLLLEGLHHPEHLGPLGLGWALVVERDPAGSVDARALIRLAAVTGRQPTYIVRALLETPAESWVAISARPALAQHWLAEFGTLDFSTVLSLYPDAEHIVARVGPRPLRAAAGADLNRDQLERVLAFATSVGATPEQMVNAIIATEADLAESPELTGPAAIAWISYRLSEGSDLGDTILELLENPGLLRTWAVEGPGISSRILADVLGTRPQDLRDLGLDASEGRALVKLLADSPGLIRLGQEIIFPRQRLALLRLAAERTDRSLVHQSVIEALPGLLDETNPGAALDQILDEHLTIAQVVRARTLGLDRAGRRVLLAMGPLATELPAEDVAILVDLGSAEGRGFAADAAQAEVRLPGTAQLLSRWGARWLPVLVGPDGRQVASLLSRYTPHEPKLATSWLLATGHNGLRALARHGDRLLDFLAGVQPPAADVLLIDELLEHDLPHAPLYALIVTYGLPRETWRPAGLMLADGKETGDVLLDLWDANSARLLS
jgi:hypothetical protein